MPGDEDKSQKPSRLHSILTGARRTVKHFHTSTSYDVSQEDVPESKRHCCNAIFPAGMISSLRDMFRLAWAIVLTNITQMWMGPISLMMVGHLKDPIQLDGAALAISVINVTCMATAQGLGTGCDTFFAQSFGSKNKKMVGIYVQKAVYVFLLALLPCIAIYLNTTSILLLIGQNPEVSRLAGRYLVIFIPGALSFFLYMILSKYLQTQNIVIPNVIIGIVANSLNAGMHYVFLYQLHWGTDASALSQAVSHFVMFSLTLIYIRWSKIYEETWGGWTTESLHDWGKFVRISISGMIMVSLDWWNFEIGTFLSGILGLTELGAMSVVLQVDDMVYEVVLGIQIAASILIGQKLGAQDKLGALTMARLVIVVLVMVSVIPLTMYLVFRDQLPYIITDVREVVDLASKLFSIISFYMFFDGIVMAGKAILCGTGRQLYGVVLMVVCHTFIAMPIGIPLMFLTRLRTEAFWWAMVGSLILQAIVIMCVVKRIDWSLEVQKAMKRAAGKVEVVPNIDDHVKDHYENTTSVTNTRQSAAAESSMVLNEQDGPSVESGLETTVDEKTLDRVGTNEEAAPKEDDPVTDHSENSTSTTNTTQSAAVKRTPDLNEDDDLTVETMPDLNDDDDITVEKTTLSTTQLIIRRGSILLLMSLILGGGIAGHLLIPVQSSTFLQSFTNTTTAIPADNITL
ncbi:Multidrug and toxin extrusion protein 1 [Lamellibrachia satsuma]|nr:Multidrug and toxin extrusion protein 1 [Lamellibrachia satsuma]